MIKRIISTLSLLFIVITLSFADTVFLSNNIDNARQSQENIIKKDRFRVGCGCCDGTTSKATGRGACSWHGGVQYWLYYDDETDEYYKVSTGRCD